MIRTIRSQCTLVSLAAALCLSWAAAACFAQGPADDLQALRKERRELLSEVSTALISNFLQFGRPFQEVAQAERDSFQADLDYFVQPRERSQAIEKHQQAADALVEIAEGLFRSARGRRLTVLQAKADLDLYRIEDDASLKRSDPTPKEHAPLPVSVSVSDITYTVINDDTNKVMKPPGKIKAGGKAKLAERINTGPLEYPPGPGHDLTDYEFNNVQAKVTISVENHAESPLFVSAGMFFDRYSEDAKVEDFKIDPGTVATIFLEASMSIQAAGAPKGGRYSHYPILSVVAADPDGVLTRPSDWTVYVVVIEPWYLKEQDAPKK